MIMKHNQKYQKEAEKKQNSDKQSKRERNPCTWGPKAKEH